MNTPLRALKAILVVSCGLALISGCDGEDEVAPVTITVAGPNVISQWNEIAATTINQPGTTAGTPEEQRPTYGVDMATVHVAMYDAVIAIAGTHKPFIATPTAPTAGASQEAAAATAAYRVLLGLFPSRGASYQAAYDTYLATLPAGTAKDRGVAVGAEVAATVLASRANDGRSITLAAFVPGTGPGQFRGNNPVNRYYSAIKPFGVTSITQFRAPGPPLLSSAAYAADVNETLAMGGTVSTQRSAAQLETARFHTEAPPAFWARNLRLFATTAGSVAEHARLMAMLWVVQADALNTCFESKYNFLSWRPTSAINLADTDGNAATTADTTWTPVLTTPNHPEYPAAHACASAAVAATLQSYYGTPNITFDFTSTVTNTTKTFTTVQALIDDVQMARIAGGMHFRTATIDGATLGRNVAEYVLGRNFQKR